MKFYDSYQSEIQKYFSKWLDILSIVPSIIKSKNNGKTISSMCVQIHEGSLFFLIVARFQICTRRDKKFKMQVFMS